MISPKTRQSVNCSSAPFEPHALDLSGILRLLRTRYTKCGPALTVVQGGKPERNEQQRNRIFALE